MPFSVVAFQRNVAGGETGTLLTATPVTDATVVSANGPIGSGFVFSKNIKLGAAYAQYLIDSGANAGLRRVRVNSTGLLDFPIGVVPLVWSGTAPVNHPAVMFLPQNPPMLPQGQPAVVELEVFTAAGTDFAALLWVYDELTPLPAGASYWIRYTLAATATVVNAWTLMPNLAFDAPLPAGTYAVTGMTHAAANGAALAARLIFDIDRQAQRPGVLCTRLIGDRTHRMFLEGALGTYGTFWSNSPPRIEVLASVNGNVAHEGWLRVVRISDH